MSQETFSSMFTGIPTAMLTSWYTGLKAEKVEVVSAFSSGESDFPTIVVKSSEETVNQQFMGFWGHRDANNVETLQMLVTEEVTIYIFSSSAEWTRALYVAVRGLMLSSTRWLISECGYDTVEYLEGGDIDPDKDLFSEDPIFTRVQRWSATGVAGVKTVDITSLIKPAVVGATDSAVTADGTLGGVKGSTSV